ncbi:MAG: hypothetical protein DRN92_07965 [Thermoproteota archaeon]|nr:MAG: hypothetical protein DRN92_07965 [Candidatus Korarchaeota archaeon]
MNLTIILAAILMVGYLSTELLLRLFIPRLKSAGILGEDIHKPDKPKIAERGGYALVLGIIITQIVVSVAVRQIQKYSLTLLCSTLIAAIVGSLDDMIDLGGKLKPLLSLPSGLPLLTSGLLYPRPVLPLIGRARLHYAYPIAALLLPGVFSNAINMIDVLNGMMASNSIIILLFLSIISILSGNYGGIILTTSLLGPLIGFYRFNKYPAKVFSGNVGSLSIGSCLASIAILGRLEAPFAIASVPLLITGFMIITSVGGFKEKKEMKIRPVEVHGNIIKANPDPRAPITLVSLLTLDRGKEEPRIVLESNLLFIISGILALLTYLFLT